MNSASLKRARAMREKGWGWNRIGDALGLTGDAVRRQLEPDWADNKRERNKIRNRERRAREKLHGREARQQIHSSHPTMSAEAKADAERLAREIPADTRDFTARMFGDPLPGRSALDQRGQA